MKLGRAFSDYVTVEGKNEGRFSVPATPWWLGTGRVLVFVTVLLGASFVLLWRLFDLTVVSGHVYRVMADGNRTKRLVRHAPRGIIYDRTGVALTENIPRYRLLKPCEGEVTAFGLQACASYISKEEGEQLIEKGLPSGWFLEVDYERQYRFPESMAHILGYVGEVSDKELTDEYYTLRHYKSGTMIGRMGAEQVYEEFLRGRDGEEFVEIDATGKILRTLGTTKEIPGEDVTVSIDASLSEVVMRAMPVGAKGAVVVSKPVTGEILAIYSSPTFSLNAFVSGLSDSEYKTLVERSDNPLFDRAIGGVYPPGSTFKLVTALAALEEEVIKKNTVFEDTGEITIGLFKFPNWFFKQYGKTEGMVDVIKALQRSNDIFFYKTGEALGITKLADWAKRIGIGKPLGIEVSGEAGGLMPNPSWKALRFDTPADIAAGNDTWYLGDTYHVSIGQGYLLTTPLQVNMWTDIIANGGNICRPTIKKVSSLPAGKAGVKDQASCKSLNIKKETIGLITQGMKKTCETGGTGYPLFDFGLRRAEDGKMVATTSGTLMKIPIACKTGTAEYGDPANKTHAWFTAFAPVTSDSVVGTGQAPNESRNKSLTGEPEISVTVLLEGAGEGSDKAAPVAKKIFEAWFSR